MNLVMLTKVLLYRLNSLESSLYIKHIHWEFVVGIWKISDALSLRIFNIFSLICQRKLSFSDITIILLFSFESSNRNLFVLYPFVSMKVKQLVLSTKHLFLQNVHIYPFLEDNRTG